MPKSKTIGNPEEAWGDLAVVREAMRRKTKLEYAAIPQLHDRNIKAKALVNRYVMGGMSKVKLCDSAPTKESMVDGMPHALNEIKMRIGAEILDEWTKQGKSEDEIIFDNRLPDGAKFSRWFIRYRKQTRNHPRLKRLSDEIYQELPALPVAEDRTATVEVFVQNFYNQLKSMGGEIWLSTRAADLLTISDHDCTWTSCTRWGGEYAASIIAYAMDPGSAVLFFKNGGRKIGRCMVYFSTEHKDKITNFSIQRRYGTVTDSNMELARKRIQTLIARNSGIEDKWKFKTNVGLTNVRRDGDVPYIDGTLSQSRHAEHTRHYDIHLRFPVPICLDCGRDNDGTSSLVCYSCRSGYTSCRICGNPISTRLGFRSHDHNGYTYCRNPECQDRAELRAIEYMRASERVRRATTASTANAAHRINTGTATTAVW